MRVARDSGHLLASAGDARGREGRSGATPREAARRRHPGVGARGGESCALRFLSPGASGPTDHCNQTAGGFPELLVKGED